MRPFPSQVRILVGGGVLIALAGAAVAVAGQEPPAAEPLDEVLRREEVAASLAWIEASEDRAVESLVELASIVSPSGEEQERAQWVAGRMRAIGLQDVSVDSANNVVGRIEGRSGRALMFVTILDDLATIADLQRARQHPPHREGDRVLGPATEVQSVTAATLLAAEALVRAEVVPEHDVVIAAVAEEETGLLGMKALFDTWRERAVAWIDVLGDGREIVYGAGSIHWWRVVADGAGGHTAEAELPHVNLAIARAVDGLLGLPHPVRYEDTFINVGMLRSGEVYNHKPVSGWFSLDLRSMEPEVLDEIEAEAVSLLDRVEDETGVRFEMHPVITIDGGQVPGARSSSLVRLAIEVSQHLGYDPVVSPKGCCNMSIPVGHGRLAIGLHGERGGKRASAEEWASVPAMIRTAKHVVLLAATYEVTP